MARRANRPIGRTRALTIAQPEPIGDEHHAAWLDDVAIIRLLRLRAANADARGDQRVALSSTMVRELARRLEARSDR